MDAQVPPKTSEENTNEQWRPVLGGHYEVSDSGRIRRKSVPARRGCGTYPGKMLRPRLGGLMGAQYYAISACIDGHKRNVTIHSLVAEAFIGPRPHGLEVNHKDLNKLNNRKENLEYVTRSQNALHAMAHLGRWQKMPQPHGKLSEHLEEIRQMRQSGMTHRQIGERFGVSTQAIQQRLKPRNAS